MSTLEERLIEKHDTQNKWCMARQEGATCHVDQKWLLDFIKAENDRVREETLAIEGSYDGKYWSPAVQKAFQAPFPEMAVQHLLGVMSKKIYDNGRRAAYKEIAEMVKAIGRKDEDCTCISHEGCGCEVYDYNKALEDILSFINSQKTETKGNG